MRVRFWRRKPKIHNIGEAIAHIESSMTPEEIYKSDRMLDVLRDGYTDIDIGNGLTMRVDYRDTGK